MRFLVAPEFSAKLTALTPAALQHVSAFVKAVGAASDKAQLLKAGMFDTTMLGESIYISKAPQITIYFTFGNDSEGEYVLLLDATTAQPSGRRGQLFAIKDPRKNSRVNPAFNTSLNPSVNSSLNPVFNSSINPIFNSSINPTFNSSINPVFNSSINPQFNSSINPRLNTTLNPRFNTAINPRMNPAFGGPYLYSRDLVQEGYLVRANDKVELLFDLSGEHIGELVRANEKVRAQFNANNKWVGYFVRANDEVALRYDVNGNWTGLLV